MAKKAYLQNDSLIDPNEAARQTWGGGDKPVDLRSARSERVQHIPVTQILPDPRQPRRAVPSVARLQLTEWRYGIWLLQAWNDELGVRLGSMTKAIIEGKWEVPDDFEPRPVEQGWLSLLDLAASIRRDGLTNPITVVRDGDLYRLETGERRWLAYCLLDAYWEGEYSTIPARVVDHFDVWRQASENSARSDLNAIGRARQFAILLMDLLGSEPFAPFEAFENEQDFYAQVSDGETHRIPHGTAPRLVAAMGLKNTVQLRQYRALLRIPPELWTLADDENWTENQLRTESVTGVTESDDDPPAPPDESDAPGGDPQGADADRQVIKGIITDKSESVPAQLPLSPALMGELHQAKTYTAYVVNSIKRTDPNDRGAMEEIARRAEWNAEFWARVARIARGG